MANCDLCIMNTSCPRYSYPERKQLASDFGCYAYLPEEDLKKFVAEIKAINNAGGITEIKIDE
jgi:hypothetical protein